MTHVVMFSSGAGSWAAAKRVAERYGTDDLTLLFADTQIEDEDNYRFLNDAARNVGGSLVTVEDGWDIWEVFRDVRFLGNSRIDPCSRILKRELLRQWLDDNCDPEDTTVHLGIDWMEIHRFERAQVHWTPWETDAPLIWKPQIDKEQILAWCRSEGIEPPRLYAAGFAHANCGGGCVKAGQAQFELLLRRFPDRYRWWEEKEAELQDYLGKPNTILRDRSGGETKPLSLRHFRERLEQQPSMFDPDEWGACSCFTTEEAA